MGCGPSRTPGLLEYGPQVPEAAVEAILAAVTPLNARGYRFGAGERFRISRQMGSITEVEKPDYVTGWVRSCSDVESCDALRSDETWIVAPDRGDGERDVIIWRASPCSPTTWTAVYFEVVAGRGPAMLENTVAFGGLGAHAASHLQAYLEFLKAQPASRQSRAANAQRGLRFAGALG